MSAVMSFNCGTVRMSQFKTEIEFQDWIDERVMEAGEVRRADHLYHCEDYYRLDSGLYADGVKWVYVQVVRDDRAPSMRRRIRPRTLVKAMRSKR